MSETKNPAAAKPLDTDELYALNSQLTQQLSEHGWNAETEDDYDALNELTHSVAEHQAHINGLLDVFMARQPSAG